MSALLLTHHPRAGGDLPPLASPRLNEIPAFAGMTAGLSSPHHHFDVAT